METTILTVMVGLAAVGFGVLGLVWRSLDRRMDRLEEGRDTDRLEVVGLRSELRSEVTGLRSELRSEVTGLRGEMMGLHREVMAILMAQTRQLGRIEGHLGLAASTPGEAAQTSEEAAAV